MQAKTIQVTRIQTKAADRMKNKTELMMMMEERNLMFSEKHLKQPTHIIRSTTTTTATREKRKSLKYSIDFYMIVSNF
jgi:hypothetical protein